MASGLSKTRRIGLTRLERKACEVEFGPGHGERNHSDRAAELPVAIYPAQSSHHTTEPLVKTTCLDERAAVLTRPGLIAGILALLLSDEAAAESRV